MNGMSVLAVERCQSCCVCQEPCIYIRCAVICPGHYVFGRMAPPKDSITPGGYAELLWVEYASPVAVTLLSEIAIGRPETRLHLVKANKTVLADAFVAELVCVCQQ